VLYHATHSIVAIVTSMTFFQLRPEAPEAGPEHGKRRYLYPLGTELAGSSEEFALPPNPSGSLSYRTAPMAADLTILGAPALVLTSAAIATTLTFCSH
jgi:hypothetical protein